MKPLERAKNKIWHLKDGIMCEGANKNLIGDVTGLRGDIDKITPNERAEKPEISDWVET